VIVQVDASVAGAVRDSDDDAVLGTAIAGEADYLVTGDEDLLSLSTFRDVAIVTPRQFLAILDEQDAP
jgi:predicted nucleic acid-binding protein